MNVSVNKDVLISAVKSFDPKKYLKSRILSLYSATIVMADTQLMTQVINIGEKYSITRDIFYEVVLQSYLFLGFPRMLTAAENLQEILPLKQSNFELEQISETESHRWLHDGLKLFHNIYGKKSATLRKKVVSIAPDIFRWMIIEGYGKVLSRPLLKSAERELSIVAFLMMENREKQLYAHMNGALNVGVSWELLKYVIDDIGEAAGVGYKNARTYLNRLRPV